jgi:hypothetical protein
MSDYKDTNSMINFSDFDKERPKEPTPAEYSEKVLEELRKDSVTNPTEDRDLLIDAICGKSIIIDFMGDLNKSDLMRWTGDQYNADWSWERNKLEKLSTRDLNLIYSRLKDK